MINEITKFSKKQLKKERDALRELSDERYELKLKRKWMGQELKEKQL